MQLLVGKKHIAAFLQVAGQHEECFGGTQVEHGRLDANGHGCNFAIMGVTGERLESWLLLFPGAHSSQVAEMGNPVASLLSRDADFCEPRSDDDDDAYEMDGDQETPQGERV
jgi:hypothetical protein